MQDVERAEETVEALADQIADTTRELEKRIRELSDRYDPQLEELEVIACRPRRADVDVRRVALLWIPR